MHLYRLIDAVIRGWSLLTEEEKVVAMFGDMPALPSMGVQGNGSPAVVNPDNQIDPAPQSISDIPPATAPPGQAQPAEA